MSESDKRSREPPLTLDKRRPPRSRGPAPVTLIVSVLILIAGAGGIVWLYRGGVRGSGEPPVVGAPADQGRTAAPPQPQAPDASAGLSIYKDNGPNAAPPAFAPPPETPGARPVPPTASAPTAPPAASPHEEAPPPAVARPEPNLERKAKSEAKAKGEDQIDALLDKDLGEVPKAARTSAPSEASGPIEVQIGAFSSKAQADESWSAAAGAAPGAMAGRGKRVVPTVKDGKTLYRTAITGFASREAAQVLCDRLKAAGRTCFVR